MEQGPDELEKEGVDREEQLIAETDRPLDEPKPAGNATESGRRRNDQEQDDGSQP
jgi:hypothetical protein